MKIFWSILCSVLLAGILTGIGFYVIPKYAMHTTNSWIVLLDKIGAWIVANWILLLVIVVLLIISITLFCVLFNKNR